MLKETKSIFVEAGVKVASFSGLIRVSIARAEKHRGSWPFYILLRCRNPSQINEARS